MVVASDADVKDQASPTYADITIFNVVTGKHFAPKRRYHFFDMASYNISDLRHSSAYIFFKRAFSISSALRREIKEASIPPYLDRQL